MKLIDLLVQELPKSGGWPLWAFEACNQNLGRVMFYNSEGGIDDDSPEIKIEKAINQSVTEEVTREQYEAALAASKQPAWICGAMPPEGCECEVKSGKDSWTLCKVVHSSSAGVAFIYLEEPNGCAGYIGVLDLISAKAAESQFRPIRTEAERKREEAGLAIYHAINWNAEGELASPSRMEDYRKAYDAIAAGKIPGVKLAD